MVTAIASFDDNIYIAHGDGTITSVKSDGSKTIKTKFNSTSGAYALAGTKTGVVASGPDLRINFFPLNEYENKIKKQSFDFSKTNDDNEFRCAASNSTGTSVCLGSWDKVKIFTFNESMSKWIESEKKLVIENLYSITCIDWLENSNNIAIGTYVGSVELLEIAGRKELICDGKYEVAYAGDSNAVITQIASGNKANLNSKFNSEIKKVSILDIKKLDTSYIIAWTENSLMICDVQDNQPSEIPWNTKICNFNENFGFERDAILVSYNGEVNIIKKGENEIYHSVKLDSCHVYHLSVKVNVDKAAYLSDQDFTSISVIDLNTGIELNHISHTTKIKWLKLNESATKLVFIDKAKTLWTKSFDNENNPIKILNYCVYASFVENSDVLVAYDGNTSISVWYGNYSDQPMVITCQKGKVQGIEYNSASGYLQLVLMDGSNKLAYKLDSHVIEFITAIKENNLNKAMLFLEKQKDQTSSEVQNWWQQLEQAALKNNNIFIVQVCAGSRNDHDRVNYCVKAIAEAQKLHAHDENPKAWKTSKIIQARLAALNQNFKQAENLFLQINKADEAIEMYQNLGMYDQAIEVCENIGNMQKADMLKTQQLSYLKNSYQEAKVSELQAEQGNIDEAYSTLYNAGMYNRAANGRRF